MDTHHQHLLWIYHNVDDIRWMGILDRMSPSFKIIWIAQAIEQLHKSQTHPKWILLSSAVYEELCRIMTDPRGWLDELDLELLIDDKLTLRPDLFRVVLLDKEYMAGAQVLWVKSKLIPEVPSPQEPPSYETLLGDDIL